MVNPAQASRSGRVIPKRDALASSRPAKLSSGAPHASHFVRTATPKRGASEGRRPSALHGKTPPALKPTTVDDQLRMECQRKFDFKNDGGLEGLKQSRPTLVRVIRRVASLTQVSFHYLIASLYVESNFWTGAVNDDAKGIAQSKRISWDELKKDAASYKKFKSLWNQMSPGRKLPSAPGVSPSADILFMAEWTLKREKNFEKLSSLEGQQKMKAQRLSYKLQAKAGEYIKILVRDGDVKFTHTPTNDNWQNFKKILDEMEAAVARAE